MNDDEATTGQRYWWRPYLVGMGAIASFVLSNLAFNYLQSIQVGGWVGKAQNVVIATLALFWLIVYVPSAWRRVRQWPGARPGTGVPPPASLGALRSYAAQAERRLLMLGSEAGGMAAAAWFEDEEPRLRTLLNNAEVGPATVDDLAWICAALETWYVRQRQAESLLELSDRLTAIGKQAERPDLEELAAIRAATANRFLGDPGSLDLAADQLRVAADVRAPVGAAEPAMRARLAVERGLLHLARADRRQGDNRDEEIHNAQKSFDEAGLQVPRADLAADIAIQLDRGLVCLYRHDSDGAKDHFQVAEERAAAAHDVSAQAHALELLGIAAWQRNNIRQAVLWWQEAQDRYAVADEHEGQARCLQHLGSAELVTGDCNAAYALLERSATLRGGTDGHEVLEHYLARARLHSRSPAEPVEPSSLPPSPAPTGMPERLRQWLRQWL